MIDEQKQPETNPEDIEQNLNSSEEVGKEEFGQPDASASQPEAAATTETSFQDTIGAAGEAELPESEKTTELPEPGQVIKALNQEIESLKQQLEQQNQQADALKKRYISLAAEFDNFRKRTQKEKEELEVQVKCKTIGELLQVVDNFERARTQIKPANEGEMAIHKSYQGVYKNLVDSLKRLGVSAMRPEGQPFDPIYHEAMLREQTDEHPEGTVLEQLVRGYILGDRVLRHAMVKVAAPKEPMVTSEEETAEKENLENQEN
jgi:molecular chaperone GrpE